jgi:hypothetical protein
LRDGGGIRDVGKDSVALVIEAIPDHAAELYLVVEKV